MSKRVVARTSIADEKAMGVIASNSVKHIDLGIKPGKPLPEDFENPPMGDRRHLCIDPNGKYRPTWSQLMILRGDATGQRQYFNEGGRPFHVNVGQWVDVPPKIIANIEGCVVEEIEMNFDESVSTLEKNVTQVINTVPRFNFRVIDSA